MGVLGGSLTVGKKANWMEGDEMRQKKRNLEKETERRLTKRR